MGIVDGEREREKETKRLKIFNISGRTFFFFLSFFLSSFLLEYSIVKINPCPGDGDRFEIIGIIGSKNHSHCYDTLCIQVFRNL